MSATILVIEDDPDTTDIVHLYLTQEGFRVLSAADGVNGLRLALERSPDLIILDLMLPVLDGLELCRQVRKQSWVPIIMLTARVDEEDRLWGLELGADDYIAKPFSPRELVARVKAVLRRVEPDVLGKGPQFLSYGDISVDLKLHEVTVGGQVVPLTPTEMRLLVLFMNEPRRVFTREQIIDRVLGDGYERVDRTVDAHVSNLRRKLGLSRHRYIHTVHGIGYRFSHE